MLSQPIVQPILEHSQKLDSQKPSLCQHSALPFDHIAEVFLELRICNHHSFPEEGSHLRPADGKHIAVAGDERQIQIIVPGSQTVSQPRPVNVEIEAALLTCLIEFPKASLVINRPDLCGVGDVDHTRLYNMLKGRILSVRTHGFPHLFRPDLSIPAGEGKHLVPGRLHSSGLMAVDVSRIGSQDSLIGPQCGRDHRQIRLGSSH